MLIKALCDYAIKNPSTIPKGFEEKQINYRIILSTDGDIVDIVPFTRTIHTKNKTETEPQIALLPKRSQKKVAAIILNIDLYIYLDLIMKIIHLHPMIRLTKLKIHIKLLWNMNLNFLKI